jgi:hypothetical protein
VYPDYRAIIVPFTLITKACCVVVALMAAHVLTPDARACTRVCVDYGGLFKPLSHIMRNLRKQFCLALYFI